MYIGVNYININYIFCRHRLVAATPSLPTPLNLPLTITKQEVTNMNHGALPPAKAGPPAEMQQTIQRAPPSPRCGSPSR